MRPGFAVTWHLLAFVVTAILYFIFVLPRWWELVGAWPHGVGTAARVATGVLLGLTAVPVVLTLLKSRKPEFGTPQLALTLRTWSIIGHVAAGALIVATAVVEIWLDLDTYGQWLFAGYGAAAALALLGATAFYLAFVAELPPPPPKPLKPLKPAKAKKERKGSQQAPETLESDTAETDDATDAEAAAGNLRNLRNRRPGKDSGLAVSDS